MLPINISCKFSRQIDSTSKQRNQGFLNKSELFLLINGSFIRLRNFFAFTRWIKRLSCRLKVKHLYWKKNIRLNLINCYYQFDKSILKNYMRLRSHLNVCVKQIFFHNEGNKLIKCFVCWRKKEVYLQKSNYKMKHCCELTA